jgi:sulfonate transport system substrate-binding protein
MNRSPILFACLLLAAASQLSAETVRIGFQKSGALLLVKAEGGLEKRLAPLGWTVAWSEFTTGAPLVDGLDGGNLDIGHVGDGAAVFAQVAGKRVEYIAGSDASPASVAIVTQAGSPLHAVADLRGRTLGVTKGTSAHYLAVKALAGAGLAPGDVTWAWLSPADARAAFEQGSIDGWAIWDPFFAAAEVQAHARVLHDGTGLTSFREYYLATPAFAAAHQDVIAAFIAELVSVRVIARQDPLAVAHLLAPLLKIDVAVLERSESRKLRYGASALSDAMITEQQAIADAFAADGLFPIAPRISDFIVHHSAP